MADPISRSAARLAVIIAMPLALLAGLGAFALLSGFSDGPAAQSPTTSATAVAMEARPLTQREETVCQALLSQLPGTLHELPQRPVTAGPEQNAAYGEPSITVACGVPAVEYEPTDTVWSLSGVCWYAREEPDRTVWTTLDRQVPVRVTVPVAYDAPGQRVTGLSPTIVETIPSVDGIPTGCLAGATVGARYPAPDGLTLRTT